MVHMRAVVLDVPEKWLRERALAGLDRWDEIWEGVLHMTPPPGGPHQSFGSELLGVLLPVARGSGLRASYETGLFLADNDYRVPDLLVFHPEGLSERGVEPPTAVLVVEVRSPGDESYEKLGFYAACGVTNVIIVDPYSRAFDAYTLHDGAYRTSEVAADGTTLLGSIPVVLQTVDTVDGPRLRVSSAGSQVDI